jgi:hypothetical protein
MTPYERVRLSRERTAATFPLPNVTDCLRYAICELAEMDDAWLRLERRDDKRNNERTHDPRAELGQAFYMLLSAAMQLGIEPAAPSDILYRWSVYESIYASALKSMARLLDMSMMPAEAVSPDYAQGAFDAAYYAMFAAGALYDWDDLDIMVDETCTAFERKHAPQEVTE